MPFDLGLSINDLERLAAVKKVGIVGMVGRGLEKRT
jgi:hypothetical protein